MVQSDDWSEIFKHQAVVHIPLPDAKFRGATGTDDQSRRGSTRGAHCISVGSREAVDRMVSEMKAAGVPVVSSPRLTGDGYYEAVVTDREGNLVEITS